MEIKIISTVENPLFDRSEIKAEITHVGEPTPKRADVRAALAKELNVPQENLIIHSIVPRFGFKSICTARVYTSKEDLLKYEPKYLIGRETGQKTHKTKEGGK
ncbi:MAG: 30S ribosomal protein S24e [Candidatus Nanoarchaeia archaeon]